MWETQGRTTSFQIFPVSPHHFPCWNRARLWLWEWQAALVAVHNGEQSANVLANWVSFPASDSSGRNDLRMWITTYQNILCDWHVSSLSVNIHSNRPTVFLFSQHPMSISDMLIWALAWQQCLNHSETMAPPSTGESSSSFSIPDPNTGWEGT
jgi:hypothetical protein